MKLVYSGHAQRTNQTFAIKHDLFLYYFDQDILYDPLATETLFKLTNCKGDIERAKGIWFELNSDNLKASIHHYPANSNVEVYKVWGLEENLKYHSGLFNFCNGMEQIVQLPPDPVAEFDASVYNRYEISHLFWLACNA